MITAKDVETIYEVPLVYSREGLDEIVLKQLDLRSDGRDMSAWEELVSRIKNPRGEVTIGIVGKYVTFEDSYKSLNEALSHGGFAQPGEGRPALGGVGRARLGERGARSWPGWTASWCRAASAAAAPGA